MALLIEIWVDLVAKIHGSDPNSRKIVKIESKIDLDKSLVKLDWPV